MERFWSNSRNIRQSIATGSEPFPGEMLNPQSELVLSKKMLDLMVEYYLASYENFDFQAPFDDGPEDSIVISRVTINKFGRCRIGSEVFDSTMSSRHVKSSFILVNFIIRDDKVDCYAGQVQYFFKHIVDFEDGPVEHNLHMFGGISRQKHLRFDIILVLMMMRKLVMSNYGKTNFILMVATVLFQYKIFFADLYL